MKHISASYIFGIHPIEEALTSGKEFEKILVQQGNRSEKISEIIKKARLNDFPVQYVPVEKLNRITRKNHQGIIGFVSPISYQPIEQIIPNIYDTGRMPFVLILDRVTDVRNFGAIARSAYAAGVDAVLVPSRGSALINADAMKTAAGALNHIAVCRSDNLKTSIDFLKESGLKIVAISENTDQAIWETDFNGPIALILGSEEDGISPAYLNKADVHIKIPMPGPIDSLNVSVAAGIACFEVVRQRFSKP